MAECISINTARSQKWDILKFFLVFLVVLGHAAEFYKGTSELMNFLMLLIYTFHMPLFIFVSGLFSKKTVNEKKYNKLIGYLAMFFALKLFEYLYKLISGGNPGFRLLSEGGSPWFMLALFSFHLITIAVKDISPKYVLPFSILLACAAGYASDIGDYLVLSRTIVFYPFFYVGYCLDRVKVEEFCTGKNKKIISACILVAVIVIFLFCTDGINMFRYLLTGKYPFARLEFHPAFGFLYRLAYYAVAALICICIVVLSPDRTKFGLAEKLGQRTLAVYGFHYVVLYFMYVRFDCRPFFEELLGGFSVIVPFVVSVMITLFFSIKIFSDILGYIINVPVKTNVKHILN